MTTRPSAVHDLALLCLAAVGGVVLTQWLREPGDVEPPDPIRYVVATFPDPLAVRDAMDRLAHRLYDMEH